jgi:hypothetical protein
LLRWLGLARSKFDRWGRRLGTPNRHNGRIPRDSWLEDGEKAKILAFHDTYAPPHAEREGYSALLPCRGNSGSPALSMI